MNQTPENKAIHLGDGAYASFTPYGELIISANSHIPQDATDVVVIEGRSIATLIEFINTANQEQKP